MENGAAPNDNMVEIARFELPNEAHALVALLKSEGVDCYVRNEYTTQVMGITNMGGVRVELLESQVERAMQVMEEFGYELPREDEQPEQLQAVSGWARHIPFLRAFSLEKQIMILFVVIAILLALFIYVGSLTASH